CARRSSTACTDTAPGRSANTTATVRARGTTADCSTHRPTERTAAVSAAPPGRIARAFSARRGHTSLIPFVTAGYPSPGASLALLEGLAALPVLAVEIGIPFSDPIADGPEIQRSSERALAAGIGPRETLELVRRFRATSELP